MIKGKGVSLGIGFGNVVILKKQERKIEKRIVENPDNEIKRFKETLGFVIKETAELIDKIEGTEKEIMNAYLMIMQDPSLINETEKIIIEEKNNVEYAVEKGFNNIIQIFENMEDEYMASRAKDILDIKNRILAKLFNEENIDISKLKPNTIIVTTELTTSDTAKLDFKNVSGIITELGGETSHTSIIARTHAIPAVAKVELVTQKLKKDDYVVINGETGEIYLNPTNQDEERLKYLKNKLEKERKELEKYKNMPTQTNDGYKVEIVANIGVPADAKQALENTADGIGLFRSEFLYMDNEKIPTEEEQYLAYKEVAEKFGEKPVIIRTLDIGGDKDLKYLDLKQEANPFLGYRAIRLCLDNIKIFKMQLRAILKASHYGNLLIMFPMISMIEELIKAKDILEECKKELEEEKIPYNENIKVGIMIEIPSVAIMANEFAQECDFFSIGTNDLIQYTIAVERGNENVAKLYTKFHPAVIKLVKQAIDGAHNAGIFCGMCGEAASDELYIPLLIGLGLDEFSMNANNILKTRRIISKLKKNECEELSKEILKCIFAEEVENKLKEFYKKK